MVWGYGIGVWNRVIFACGHNAIRCALIFRGCTAHFVAIKHAFCHKLDPAVRLQSFEVSGPQRWISLDSHDDQKCWGIFYRRETNVSIRKLTSALNISSALNGKLRVSYVCLLHNTRSIKLLLLMEI